MRFASLILIAAAVWNVGGLKFGVSSTAAAAAPNYQRAVLQSIYPAGGGRGQSIDVVFTGTDGGLTGADEIIIDGPPGIAVSEIVPHGKGQIKANFQIDADAVPGRRMVRVKGGATGLTNFRWFFVGPTAEVIESEKNNTPDTAQQLTLPVVVNGRIDPTLDQDCFRFEARAGQTIVAAVVSHGQDAMGYDRATAGFADTSLELLDEQGRVLAEAGDTIGFDPLIRQVITEHGWYTVRVSGMGYKGFPQMVYRLTLGDVPYPTAILPLGGRSGGSVDCQWSGPNVPPGTRRTVAVSAQAAVPTQWVSLDGFHELPFLRLDRPATIASADSRQAAQRLDVPSEFSGRFERAGQQHWFRVSLEKGQSITLSVTAQRLLRSPVDTLLEVFDADGQLVAKNDDGEIFAGECEHEFVPFDSFLEFTAKAGGDYFVAVREQSGASGPRAVFHLSARATVPDFRIFQWPDAVPIWGPGATTAFVVETHRLGGLRADIELHIEGLPAGWKSGTDTALFRDYRPPRGAFGHKTFLTITAPPDAKVGDLVEFHVIGRAVYTDANGAMQEREHRAQALSQIQWSEPNRFRPSPVARAVIAPPATVRLESAAEQVSGRAGETIQVPVRVIQNGASEKNISLSFNRAGTHFKCAIGTPVAVNATSAEVSAPLKIPENLKPGTYTFVVADAWSSETRKGLPGPCTRLIRLTVEEP